MPNQHTKYKSPFRTGEYMVECRHADGKLMTSKESEEIRKKHPFLDQCRSFTMDELCYYMSYGQGRNQPSGPMDLPAFMESIGFTYRKVTW